MDPSASLVLLADAATATASFVNAAALNNRRIRERIPARRAALAALSTLSAGIAIQSAFTHALFAAHRAGHDTSHFLAADAWIASRALLLAGTLMLAAIIARSAS